jgi:hypothetical protein
MRFLNPHRTVIALLLGTLGLGLGAGVADAKTRWFHSPSGNVQCELTANDGRGAYAYCQTYKTAKSATLRRDGRTRVCRGARCLGDGPQGSRRLAYGKSIRVGPFRCQSRRSGMRCAVVASGRGFEISASKLRRF